MSVQRLINRMMGSLSKQHKDIKDNCDVVSIMEKEVALEITQSLKNQVNITYNFRKCICRRWK